MLEPWWNSCTSNITLELKDTKSGPTENLGEAPIVAPSWKWNFMGTICVGRSAGEPQNRASGLLISSSSLIQDGWRTLDDFDSLPT